MVYSPHFFQGSLGVQFGESDLVGPCDKMCRACLGIDHIAYILCFNINIFRGNSDLNRRFGTGPNSLGDCSSVPCRAYRVLSSDSGRMHEEPEAGDSLVVVSQSWSHQMHPDPTGVKAGVW